MVVDCVNFYNPKLKTAYINTVRVWFVGILSKIKQTCELQNYLTGSIVLSWIFDTALCRTYLEKNGKNIKIRSFFYKTWKKKKQTLFSAESLVAGL